MHTVLRSATKHVVIGPDQPFCIIGERINPTGRKALQDDLRRGDLSRVEKDVAEQVAGGAMVLDVNMGAPFVPEVEMLARAVKLVQSLTNLPLCTDSSIVEALDAGLASYEGKALVNSVTAEDERMEAILPLVRKYGAAVIALPNDHEEIPEDPRRRVELARKIIDVGLDRRPELWADYFGHYRRVVWLAQRREADLEAEAAAVAAMFQLPLTVIDVGTFALELELEQLVCDE